MGLKRIHGYEYYYRSFREGGRHRTRYVGGGELANLAALLDAEARELREERRRAEREERDALQATEHAVRGWFSRIEGLARLAMNLSGYHLHKRSEWRRARAMDKAWTLETTDTPPTLPVGDANDGLNLDRLISRAQRGDRASREQLRDILAAEADGERERDLLEVFGNPPEWLTQYLAKAPDPKNFLMRESIPLEIARVQRELEGPRPTVIEKLLAQRTAFCWFQVYFEECLYHAAGNMTLRQAEHRQRLISAAHRRFLAAAKTLAVVRRLAVPAVLLNVAKNQQINVEGQVAST